MTNPNQLCDVLLFVCSKIADETNLNSKLPVADRTRNVSTVHGCPRCGEPDCKILPGTNALT